MRKHLALVGFMASGKSTIGKKLARKLKCAFFDSDDIIVKDHGEVADIFYNEGESVFRKYEHDAIEGVIEGGEPGVLALGGGAVTYEPTDKLVKKRTYRIFIKVSPEQVQERLKHSLRVRPLLGPTPSLHTIKELYTKRMPLYAHADLVVEADAMDSSQVVDHIVEWLHKKKIEVPLDRVVNDDLGYRIVIDDDVRRPVASFASDFGGRCVILCDANPHVTALARQIARQIPNALGVLPFALGETGKRLRTLERVLDGMLGAGTDRQTLAIGVGGGVASDLFGFAAATYMRGIGYAHVATTLVAMADAAIGGKNGVDLAQGKNLAGTFTDPLAVFAHVDALQTLPYRHLREGLAEVVKAGVIEGNDLFESIETLAPHEFWRWPWIEVIDQAIRVKTMIVADDKHERGMRELLNLGHTFAHGLERASNFRITHGAAVALGLRAAGLLGRRIAGFGQEDHLRVLAVLAMLGMPLRTSIAPEAVIRAMESDKKKRNGKLRFVVPHAIGDVEYGIETSERVLRDVMKHLTREPGAVG